MRRRRERERVGVGKGVQRGGQSRQLCFVCGERWAAAGGKMLDGLEAEAARLALAASHTLSHAGKQAGTALRLRQASGSNNDHGQGA